MRIALIGSTGQLGWELQRALAPLGHVTALRRGGEAGADLTDPEALRPVLMALHPDAIVNAAAYTAVDRAESEADAARAVNASAPKVMAEVAAALQVPLVHYGTDYVFDGSGDQPRDETAPTAPLNVYGATKLEGEEHVRASRCTHLILRTSWVYAARGGNFARTMLKLAAERDQLKVIDDQFGAPTGADLLADVTAHCIRACRAEPALAGTYHAVAAGETTWHRYASLVIAWARANGLPVKVAPDAIEAVPTTAFPTPAKRPLNSRLDTTRLRDTFGLALPHWEPGVIRMLKEVYGK